MNLADHLSRHIIDEPAFSCACGWVAGPDDTWPEHVASSWQEARTVTTLDQLRELPDYVVIADAGGAPWTRGAFGWRSSGLERGHSSISLPARILHNPKEDQ